MNRNFVSGVLAVGLTYVYFLIFAQYGFIHLLQEKGLAEKNLELVMVAMGSGGLLASFLTAWLLGRTWISSKRLLSAGFLGSCLASLGALGADQVWSAVLVSTGIGLALGLLTVSLAVNLRSLLPTRFFGLGIGLGTGTAYAFSNLTFIFEGSATGQTVFCSLLAGMGFVLSWQIRHVDAAISAQSGTCFQEPPHWKSFAPFLALVLGFFFLVWLDSAAFFVIQSNEHLKSVSWAAPLQKTTIALTHFGAAVGTGLVLDLFSLRNQARSLVLFGVLVSFCLLWMGYTCLEFLPVFEGLSGMLYVAGVSIYSTLLVAVPGLSMKGMSEVPPRWRSGLLYGVAGWIGSANGIGMAKELHQVPPLFFGVAGICVLICVFVLEKQKREFLVFLTGVVAVLTVFALTGRDSRDIHSVQHGRGVYISEGCIHCHSQYVRPSSTDLENFGRSGYFPELTQQNPPLIGYRRQGPDLSHTASRKPRVWQKSHLLEPRKFSSGSVMPSYAYLFKGEGSEGNALLDYLETLK